MLEVRGVTDLTEVGRGGTSVVYRGVQTNFGRTVAVKVFDLTLQRDSDRERFHRECRAIGSLSGHPNIVTVFDEGVLDDGRPYLVMEYLPTTLGDELALRGQFSWQQAAEVTITIAGALGAAHRAGILHRDVKPENVLLTSNGVPKLTDFGLAQVAGGFESKTSTVRASLSHASPELIEGHPVSAASDVYSLASTMHHLISGRPPFVNANTDSIVTIVTRIVRDDPPSLAAFDVPAPLCALLIQSMSKDPAARPQDVGEFAASIQQTLGSPTNSETYHITAPVRITTDPVNSRPVGATTPKRRRQTLAVLAFAALFGAIGAAVFAAKSDDSPRPTTTAPTTSTNNATTSSPTSSTSSTSSTSTTTAPTSTTIAAPVALADTLARDYPIFTELLGPDFIQQLNASDPYTVFAVPDEAFANVPAATMDQLRNDANVRLAVLAYHLTLGNLSTAQIVIGPLTMFTGEAAQITSTDGVLKINDAVIVEPETAGTNGVIHRLDRLLIPPSQNLGGIVDPPPTTVPRGTITTTTKPKVTATPTPTVAPPPTTTLAPATTATPTTADPRVRVPDGLVGADPNTARGKVQDAGLVVAEASDPGCTGLNKVTSTSPSSGSLVNRGSTVTLYICY